MAEIFPFAALIGQAELKKALLLCAINPAVGGILIRGEKGTAKSTAVRGLADILPEMEVRPGCPYACDPNRPDEQCPLCRGWLAGNKPVRRPIKIVTLPLNATEDRVAGSLDFERAVKKGQRQPAPGLLAEAHRGLLYVDEVNLLDDHLVDIILDVAASGQNRLEREGISLTHPSRFMLVGTMNPEEGDLRPQLLDRFGLCVSVSGRLDPVERVELMLEREKFDRDRRAYIEHYQSATLEFKRKVSKAVHLLPRLSIERRILGFISELATEKNVAGHRADLFMREAALALAALRGEPSVTEKHVIEIAPLVLAHRQREAQEPPPPPPSVPQQEGGQGQNQENADNDEPQPANPDQPESEKVEPPSSEPDDVENDNENPAGGAVPEDMVFQIGETFQARNLESDKDRLKRRGSGRRSRSRVSQKHGRYIKSGPNRDGGDIALDATLRAAAPFQIFRSRPGNLAVALQPSDIREKEREKRLGNYIFFLVDASGSMGARGRMAASKGAVMSLLLDAYQKRDRVGLISFRRREAQVNLSLTTSVDLAGKLLAEMPVGGRTPLSAGLSLAWRELRNALVKNPLARPIVVLVTDGKCNVALGSAHKPFEETLILARAMAADQRITYIVVDTEEPNGPVKFDLASGLASALEARYFRLSELRAESLVNIVKGVL